MKTIQELAMDYARDIGRNFPTTESDFMAGAAAMAALFASGQALKIEAAPRKYFFRWRGEVKNPKKGYFEFCHIIEAYDFSEATKFVARKQFSVGCTFPLVSEMRPALASDIESVKEIT